jgi:hypothetical protein
MEITCRRSLFYRWLALTLLLLLAAPAPARAQAEQEPQLTLNMSRTFGYSSGGGDIQGVFSLRASGPEDLERVVFFLDDQVLAEVTAAPFNHSFTTDDYPIGQHTITAVGYTGSGAELQARLITVNFVSAEESRNAAVKIIVPILGLVVLMLVLSAVIPMLTGRKLRQLPPGTPRNYGMRGGTICKNCGRPFSLNFLSLNMGLSKLERCPYCGRWSLARSMPLEKLRAAEQAELEAAGGAALPHAEAGKQQKEIDDSRFTDL